ncbi:MerR family transcriptional regulator [Streptomyces profundus]|nr:MerR family transcriptional regulator [Streptomyces sp. MA3_2.13]
MRIGELATRAGVSVRSLRYYEERGLLTSTRSASGQRHYTDHDVDRVRFLQRLFAAGLSSRTITELLPCVDKPSAENSDIALERMAEERDRLSTHIEELIRTRDALDGLMAVSRSYREAQRGAEKDPVSERVAEIIPRGDCAGRNPQRVDMANQ